LAARRVRLDSSLRRQVILKREINPFSSQSNFLPDAQFSWNRWPLREFRLESPDAGRLAQKMTAGTLFLIVLLFALVGAMPKWPHSAGWGYWPSGLIAISIVAVAIFMLAEGSS
jgi:hypothetical protein